MHLYGGNITLEEDNYGYGGDISANLILYLSGGDVTFANLNSPPGQSNYDMVVSDQTSGQLYKMSMSGMGGHWSSDASGNNIYVGSGKKIGIGTNDPQSSLHVDGGSGDAVTITTDYKLTMQHYNSSFGTDEKRPFLKKDWVNSPSYGDVLYIGSTGNRSNTNQTAMLFTMNKGIMMGSGHNSGNNITEKWLTVESDTTVLYPDATNASTGIGDANFIINDMNNSGYGGMYVNAPKPFYGYAVDGTEKAKTYYEESNGVKYLKWDIAGSDRMKLDGNGKLEVLFKDNW